MARQHPADVRDDQLRRADQIRTATAVAASALTITLALVAGATLPGRSTATPAAQTTQNTGGDLSGLQGPDQAPSTDTGSSAFGGGFGNGVGGGGGYGGGGFVINSGGS